MKLSLSHSLMKWLTSSFLATISMHTLYAGHMREDLGYMLYRNLAENKGGFDAGATDVAVYDSSGKLIGTIAHVPDFSPFTFSESGNSLGTLAGGQSWLIDCGHNTNYLDVDFSIRSGTAGTSVQESYKIIKLLEDPMWDGSYNYNLQAQIRDMAVSRLNKVVTDVVNWELTTNEGFINGSDLSDAEIWRVGAGTHLVYDTEGKGSRVVSAYTEITAGTIKHLDTHSYTTELDNGRGASKTVELYLKDFGVMDTLEGENFMPNKGNSGDSGSPLISYNEDTNSFQLIGNHIASSHDLNPYTTRLGTAIYSEDFYDFVISSSEKHFDATEGKWEFSAASSEGFVQISGRDTGRSDAIRTLKQGERGYTSTVGTQASDSEMWETLDWVFQSDGDTTLSFTGSLDSGAGSFQFRRGSTTTMSEPTLYTLEASSGSVNVNNAGYIIEEYVQVSSKLTGKSGDEWRIVGENARFNASGNYETYGGFFEIAGSGDNSADLNLGVGITVYLNRDAGFSAANNVQINTGASVILADAQQIAGKVEFGNGGGILDLNGNNYARTSENFYIFDRDARVANYASGTEATFDYRITTSDPVRFKAALHDAGSAAQASVLHANFSSDVAQGEIEFSNNIHIAGDVTLSNLNAFFVGHQVEYAETSSSLDPNIQDIWREINVNVNNLQVKDQTRLTIDRHAHVTAQQLSVELASTLVGRDTASYTGDMIVSGVAELDQGFTHRGGTISVGATGSLNINQSDRISSRTTTVQSIENEGQVSLTGRLALGDTILNEGTLSISEDVRFDLSLLSSTATGGGLSYLLYTGTHTADFGELTSRNVIGDGADDYRWTFSDVDGRVTAELITEAHWLNYSKGATLELKQDVAAFDGGESFQNKDLIRFRTTESTLSLAEDNLVAERILIDQTQLNIVSNGYQMDVYKLTLTEGASLHVLGDALNDQVTITQQDARVKTSVLLNMDGQHLENKRWLDGYTGNLELQNGSYTALAHTIDYSTLDLSSDAKLILGQVQSISSSVLGEGTLSIVDTDSVTFENIADFKGVIESAATTIFNSTTQAEIQLEGLNLFINASGDYQGKITGDAFSTIHISNQDRLVLSNLKEFSGTLKLNEGGLKLMNDLTSLQKIEYAELSTIELADGVQVVSSEFNSYFSKVGFNLVLGEGAHLNTDDSLGIKSYTTESPTLLDQTDALDISGKGTYSIRRALMSSNGLIHVGEGSTFHVKGTDNTGSRTSLCFWGTGESVIDISGTMIVESMISSESGSESEINGHIYVNDGGILQLKKGGMYTANNSSIVEVSVLAGGTLLLGEQSDSTDYSQGTGYMGVYLEDESRLGALGTGERHIYHTVHSFRKDNDVHILVESGQNLHIHSELRTMDVHIQGAGGLQLYQAGHNLGITLSASRLHFMQEDISLNQLQIEGHSSIAVDQLNAEVMRAQPSGSISTESLGIAAKDASLALDSSVARISIGDTVLANKTGNMSIATLAQGAAVKMSATQFENAHISHASIAAQQGMTLESLTLTATDFTLGAGSTLVSNSIIKEGSSFTLHADTTSLLFDHVTISLNDAGDLLVATTDVKNIVTIQDSSIEAMIAGVDDFTSLLPGDQVTITGLDGVGDLMRAATLAGSLYLDIVNVDLVSMITMNQEVSFFLEGLDLSAMTQLGLENVVLTSAHSPSLYFDDLYVNSAEGGILVQVSRDIIPEPSTATLGLLALTGLLARRRRKQAA